MFKDASFFVLKLRALQAAYSLTGKVVIFITRLFFGKESFLTSVKSNASVPGIGAIPLPDSFFMGVVW